MMKFARTILWALIGLILANMGCGITSIEFYVILGLIGGIQLTTTFEE